MANEKVCNNTDAVHYYDWIHFCCQSIFPVLSGKIERFLDQLSSNSHHPTSYKYYNIKNIINSWYKSVVIIFLFTPSNWIDTFLHLYSITYPFKPYKKYTIYINSLCMTFKTIMSILQALHVCVWSSKTIYILHRFVPG